MHRVSYCKENIHTQGFLLYPVSSESGLSFEGSKSDCCPTALLKSNAGEWSLTLLIEPFSHSVLLEVLQTALLKISPWWLQKSYLVLSFKFKMTISKSHVCISRGFSAPFSIIVAPTTNQNTKCDMPDCPDNRHAYITHKRTLKLWTITFILAYTWFSIYNTLKHET